MASTRVSAKAAGASPKIIAALAAAARRPARRLISILRSPTTTQTRSDLRPSGASRQPRRVKLFSPGCYLDVSSRSKGEAWLRRKAAEERRRGVEQGPAAHLRL